MRPADPLTHFGACFLYPLRRPIGAYLSSSACHRSPRARARGRRCNCNSRRDSLISVPRRKCGTWGHQPEACPPGQSESGSKPRQRPPGQSEPADTKPRQREPVGAIDAARETTASPNMFNISHRRRHLSGSTRT
eukprot:1107296-Prorocentrum_minimum.AAC.2